MRRFANQVGDQLRSQLTANPDSLDQAPWKGTLKPHGNPAQRTAVAVWRSSAYVRIMGNRRPSRDARECTLSFSEMTELADRLEITATAELFRGHDKVASDLRQGARVIRFLLSKLGIAAHSSRGTQWP